MSSKKILIGGGSGYIGSHLNRLLTKNGYDVTIISRMPGVKRITWHELDAHGLPSHTTGVINLAGQNVMDATRRWTPGFKQNVWNSRINTTSALAKAIVNATEKPCIFVNIAGVGLYKPDNSQIYTEKSKPEEFDFLSKLCVHWEKAAELPSDQKETRKVTMRCGVVLGRNGGMVQSMLLPFSLGLGGPIKPGTQPLPWIHIDDLCNLIKFSIETPKVNGIINCVAPDIITNAEFTKAFAKALRRPAFFPMPEQIVKLIFGEERSAMILQGPKIKTDKALEYGFTYKYPKILDACKEVVKKR